MFNLSFEGVTTNLTGLVLYSREHGEYGLLEDGCIRKIEFWSSGLDHQQELHFKKPFFRRIGSISSGEWAHTKDFKGFSDSKKALRKLRRFLRKTGDLK